MKSIKAALMACGALGAMQTASAQTTPQRTTTDAAAQDDASQSSAQDIIVTANKREQSVQRVGLSITAVSGDALAERRITNLQDLAAAIPGLDFSPSATNTPILTLRGIGFNESSLGVYPAVSVYIDQAPLPFPVLASHTAYDLERVEVLKGPQGTLFGQNSTGGAINYIAAKPLDHFAAGGDISYGRFNQVDGNAFVTGPLSDTLSGRIAVSGLRADPWQKSYTSDRKNGKQGYYAGRALLNWEPSDSARFSLNVNGWVDKSEPQAQQLVAIRSQVPSAATPQLLNYPFSPKNNRAADWSEGLQSSTRKFYQASLRADIDVTDSITLTSLSSYSHLTQRQATDADGMSIQIFDLPVNNGKVKSFNQELRLADDNSDTFRWVVGVNLEKSKTFEDQLLQYFDGGANNPSNLFIYESRTKLNQNIRNLAAFANGEYKLAENLTLKAGMRYTDSRNRAGICGLDAGDGRINSLFDLLGGLLSGGQTFPPLQSGQCYVLNYDFQPGIPFQQTLHEHNVSWRAGIDYQANPDTLLYANVSRGYKAGSFPELAPATYIQLEPVTQESVTSYEAGFKTTFADRMVTLNGAAFYYDYKDKQVRGKLLDPIFGILDTLVNIPKSRVWGLEAELSVRPASGLTVSASGTYINSKVLEYSGQNVIGFADDFRGDPLPLTPKWAGQVAVDYRMALPSGGTPFIGLTVSGRTSADGALGGSRIAYPANATTIVRPGVTYPYHIDGYVLVNGQIGYEAPDEAWRVMVWGKNILNKYYWTAVPAANDSSARLTGRPATYGITFGVNF
ncbi:TonB-dependent receptor precursor [Novosphingobium resinovorum]|uniref:TonB-dependent receptor n=1 Tax=Novosphingobium resinovorum TaxID=158500 RepID=A0A031JSH8_9SPHN|nr:TonB-dependent receptor [Novosphingobium resinovorum]EZP79307.1 TonB-dependent receptor precursor [Novosphingobium resinovorum]